MAVLGTMVTRTNRIVSTFTLADPILPNEEWSDGGQKGTRLKLPANFVAPRSSFADLEMEKKCGSALVTTSVNFDVALHGAMCPHVSKNVH